MESPSPHGSGDFSGQASEPQPFDIRDLSQRVAEGALNDAELNFDSWQGFPAQLAEYSLNIIIERLIELGYRNMTIVQLGALLGVVHEDGSWV